MEHPHARDLLSKAILEIAALPLGDQSSVIALLRKAHSMFPESIQIAAELGNLLYATGEGVEARNFFDYACSQQLAADLCKQDGQTQEIPYQWQFSRHIRQILSP
jgi:uncharacterized protein HemY